MIIGAVVLRNGASSVAFSANSVTLVYSIQTVLQVASKFLHRLLAPSFYM